jgi:hypothetical protein
LLNKARWECASKDDQISDSGLQTLATFRWELLNLPQFSEIAAIAQ